MRQTHNSSACARFLASAHIVAINARHASRAQYANEGPVDTADARE